MPIRPIYSAKNRAAITATRFTIDELRFPVLVLETSRFSQSISLIRPFPAKLDVVAAEVAIGSGLLVDGFAQVKIPDDGTRAQVKGLGDQLADLLIRDLAGAEGLHVDAEGVGHADGIGHLDLAAVGQAGSHHVLGHPAAGIRRGAIHFRGVFA